MEFGFKCYLLKCTRCVTPRKIFKLWASGFYHLKWRHLLTGTLKIYMLILNLHVCLSLYASCACMQVSEDRRGYWISRKWSYTQLLAAWCGYSELNVCAPHLTQLWFVNHPLGSCLPSGIEGEAICNLLSCLLRIEWAHCKHVQNSTKDHCCQEAFWET